MNKQIFLPIIACISTLLIIPTAHPYLSTATTTDKSLVAAQVSPAEISQVAQRITVKVLAGDSRGSGILIAHQGQVYTVVTVWEYLSVTSSVSSVRRQFCSRG